LRVALCLLAILPLAGCVSTFLAVENNLAESVVVTSGHTGDSFRIGPKRIRRVPHTVGSISVQTASGEQREYPNVDSRDGQNTRYFIFWRKVVKPLEIDERHGPTGQSDPPDFRGEPSDRRGK